MARLRIAAASRGDPNDPRTASGVAHHLFAALGRRYDLRGRVDVLARGWQRWLVALASFHPSRAAWPERFDKNLLAFRLQSWNCGRALRRLGDSFDVVVQVYGLFQTPVSPYVLYIDNTHALTCERWPAWNPFRGRDLNRWLRAERRLYQQAAHVFTMGTPAANSVIHSYGVMPERVSVVGGGANFDELPAVAARRSSAPTVLFVGRDFRRKGGDILFDAFRSVRTQVPDARLVVAGTDQAPREPGVDVLGRVRDRDAVARLYAHATVFCLPSRFEPYGLVLLEAMAHGLPCVATRGDAFPEIVEDGRTGLLVPHGEASALAGALVALLEDHERARALGAAGRRRVEETLNWDAVVGRMAPALEQVSGSKA
jgi:glycosyltransferase involved in cell wall biosynthesis